MRSRDKLSVAAERFPQPNRENGKLADEGLGRNALIMNLAPRGFQDTSTTGEVVAPERVEALKYQGHVTRGAISRGGCEPALGRAVKMRSPTAARAAVTAWPSRNPSGVFGSVVLQGVDLCVRSVQAEFRPAEPPCPASEDGRNRGPVHGEWGNIVDSVPMHFMNLKLANSQEAAVKRVGGWRCACRYSWTDVDTAP